MKSKFIYLILAFTLIVMTSAVIDLNNLDNYANQTKPNYITKDNTPVTNQINDKGATLGRVLFYDKKLSANNTIACGSCHMQQFAFGDTATQSKGFLGGNTGRHSMRLINARFGVEAKFFWDERATSLENQTTQPMKDAVEMGWSGTSGQGNMDSLIKKMYSISYYKVLFPFVYGDTIITEARIQSALGQFIRSIQSFDSKFDIGLAGAPNLNAPFSNYTAQENQGKTLFLAPPPQGGAGCQACHAAPEFDIDPNTDNNGVIAVAGSTNQIDITNTRAPSLRDLFNTNGILNTPLMHNGNFKTIDAVINHYNAVPINALNTNLDPRLQGPGGNLNLTQTQKDALIAFLKTLSGNDVYTNPKWSDPFDSNGNLTVIPVGIKKLIIEKFELVVFPNPAQDIVNIKLAEGNYELKIYDATGKILLESLIHGNETIDIKELPAGNLFIVVLDTKNKIKVTKRLIKIK
ncbi:MAG: cytochrome c peroxidase [Bacteroidia bacterium]